MKFNIEDITDKDVDIAMNFKSTYGELVKAHDLAEKLKSRFDCNDEVWRKICMILYAYKLGEMQGTRNERAKNKRRAYCIGGAE
ncbi:hypothetical protein [Clostridium neonatale]|uniref:hypothetical protein n=1 Tax=Clostridium neonatale TaxID=137838 RepID=UPI00374F38F8